MNLDKIGKNIRQERKKQHLTIAQLAEKAEISDNFMGNIERGTDIPSLADVSAPNPCGRIFVCAACIRLILYQYHFWRLSGNHSCSDTRIVFEF